MKRKALHVVTAVTLLFSLPFVSFGQAPVLGTTRNFALFTAAGAFENTGDFTVVTGDVGTHVGAFSGFPPGTLHGDIHVADAVTAIAAAEVSSAYMDLAGRICDTVLNVTMGGLFPLTPRVYCTGAASTLDGILTLDAQGDPDAIFIFQIGGAFATSPNAQVLLINGANLCNVYWQINGAFTLGENALFVGTVIAEGAINLHIGSTLNGRALSTAGAISSEDNFVTMSLCLAPTVTCPADELVSCDDLVPPPDIASVSVTTTCPGAFSVTFEGDVVSNLNCTNQYTITRTYLVTDACGETATCAQTITVNDQIPPTITCPTDVVVSCFNLAPLDESASILTSDNCGGTVTVSLLSDVPTGQVCSNIVRTYEAVDACGITATCEQTITVNDQVPPTITCPPVTSPIQCPATPVFPQATATDDCAGNPDITFVDVNTPSPQGYSVTRTWTATDDCNNSAECSSTIVVEDNSSSTITCPTSVPNLLANANCQAILGDYTALVSTSNGCGGGPLTPVVQSPAAGTIVNPGTVAIHLTVINTAGQSVECTFNVNISGGCN